MQAPDDEQMIFAHFRVPDQGRILKAKKWLVKHVYIRAEGEIAVLEVGYAKGGFLDNLREYRNIKKYAVDINDREVPHGVTFVKHDCNYGLPCFGGAVFDVIFGGELLEHLIEDEKFLLASYGLLRPGGILVLTVPNMFFLLNRLVFPFGRMPYFAYARYHYHFYDVPTLCSIIRQCGFRVKHVASSHIFISSRRNRYLGRVFEFLGNIFPRLGAHILVFATKP
jgi:SAM-dependent methyltransferase